MGKIEIKKIKIEYLILALIIIISGFFRLYRIGELHTFHNDEGRDAMIAAEMIRTHKPTLLGPQTSVGNMYLGPLYYYLMVPPLILSGGDPVGPAVMIALSGVLTTFLIYLIGRRWFGVASGLVSAAFFAISPLYVHYTGSSWNPNLVPLVALLLLFAWESKQSLVMGLLVGVLFQLHYVALAYAAVLSLWLLVSERKLKTLLWLIVGFLISTSAFWLFELRHDFLNLQALFAYLEGTGVKNGATAPYLMRLARNGINIVTNLILSKTLTYNISNLVMVIISSLTLIFTLPWLFPKPSRRHATTLWIILISTLLISSLLKENLYPHYLGYLFPIISLLLGSILAQNYRPLRYFGVAYLTLWLLYSAPVTTKALGGEGSQQKLKGIEVAGYISRDAGGESYNVVASQSNSRETTYLYYLWRLPSPPSRQPEKLLYIICEDSPCTQQDVNTPLLFSRGTAHPYLDSLISHPYQPITETPKTLVSSTHIVYGVWVGRVIVGQ